MHPRIPIAARIPGRTRRRYTCRRYSSAASSSTSPYHPKVHALPFAIGPSLASAALETFARDRLLNFPDLGQMWEYAKNTPLDRPILQDVRFNMKQIRAVYVPTWMVAVCVSMHYVLKETKEVGSRIFGIDGPIPGHSLKPLYTMWPEAPFLKPYYAIPFTASLLTTKWGDKVIPLEYTVSPFKLIDMCNALPASAGEFEDIGITINPNMEFSHLAVFPVLRPIYLAEFSQAISSATATLILPAHVEEDLSEGLESVLALKLHKYIYRPASLNGAPQKAIYTSEMAEFASGYSIGHLFLMQNLDSFTAEDVWETRLEQVVQTCRQDSVRWDSIGGVNQSLWDDPRVMQYTHAEYLKHRNIVMEAQVAEALKIVLHDLPGLSADEIERKAARMSKYLYSRAKAGLPPFAPGEVGIDELDRRALAAEEFAQNAKVTRR